jgi:YVTN family beta-propeller protein
MKDHPGKHRHTAVRLWLHHAGRVILLLFGGLLPFLVFGNLLLSSTGVGLAQEEETMPDNPFDLPPDTDKDIAPAGINSDNAGLRRVPEDIFGYTFLDSNDPGGPVYNWEDISSTGALVTGWTSTDDGYAGPVSLGFMIDYYGNAYDELYVGSNGYVSFGQGYGSIPWGSLPSTDWPNNDIGLFGDDMYLYNYGTDSRVYYATLSNPARFVLQFENLYYCCGQNIPHTFQLILYPNGDILAQYQSLNGTSTTYVGIENEDGSDGLSYGSALADDLAIQYYYPSGLFFTPAGISGYGPVGATVSYTLQLANLTGVTDTFDLALLPGNNWATTLSMTQTGVLADRESIDIGVLVDIPPTANPGDMDTAILEATSVLSPTVISNTAAIQTTATSEEVAYVAVANYDYLALVDAVVHIVVDTVDLNPAGCNFPWRVNIPPDGQTVWVSCRYSDNVVVLDRQSNAVITTINIQDPAGIGFTHDSAFALVGSNSYLDEITLVDTSTYFMSTLGTSGRPTGIAIHPFLPLAYATNRGGSVLDVIDLTSFTISTHIDIGYDSEFAAIAPDGTRLYTSNRGDYTISAIDTLTNLEIARIPIGDHPLDLALNADGSRLYVSLANAHVAVVDTATLTTLPPYQVDPLGHFNHPWGADMSCLADLLFVTNSQNSYDPDGRQVAVIDVSADPETTALIPMPDTDNDGRPDYGARGVAVCSQGVGQDLLITPPEQAKSAALGEMVTYEATLLNFTGISDTYTLTLGSHNWPTSLSDNVVGPLANTASLTFTVQVTVPLAASWYQTDTIEVTATSVTSPTIFVNSAVFVTEAYAPPEIAVAPDSFTSTQLVNEVTTQTLTIGNGNGVDLSFSLEAAGGGGVSPFAASTELYGYETPTFPQTYAKIVGLEDDTNVRLIDLEDGSIQIEEPDLDQYEVLNAYPGPSNFFKIESDKPVVGFEFNSRGSHSTFIPAVDGDAVGNEFIFYYFRPNYFYAFAIEAADVEVYDTNGVLVATQSIPAGDYWDMYLNNGQVYHVISTGRIVLQAVGENGYTTVPDVTGTGIGRQFYFATHYWQYAAIAVFAYQDTDIEVYDLDSGSLLWSAHIDAGDHWWQTDSSSRRLRLESTGDVEVWAGSTEGGNNIEDLGDDVSFAGGDQGRNYYLHSLEDGSVIFAPFANTRIDVDGTVYDLDKDEYLHLDGCCAFRHIQSNQPILIQTLGGDTSWNDIGTYLGGVNIYGGPLVTWLSTDPVSGTVANNSNVMVQVIMDSNGIQPGDYPADLLVASNDPDSPTLYVPVTMTVEPTANMGWVDGIITDASTAEPLAATITALGQPYVVYSDPDTGYYKLWLDAGSYTLEVSAADYVTGTAAINISAQQGTSQDFALVPFRPVMQVDPDTIDVILEAGQTTNRAITITNTGPAPLQFEIRERANEGQQNLIPTGPLSIGEHTQSPSAGSLTQQPADIQPERPSLESHLEDNPVLIIQDRYPWGYDSIQQVLSNLGIAFDQVNSSEMATIDLSGYELVIIPSDQYYSFYTQWNNHIDRFESYVMSGGALWLSACTGGELFTLPGNVAHHNDYDDFNIILEPNHPWVANVPNPMQGYDASHNSFSNLPPGAVVVAAAQSSNGPTLVDYELGGGRVFLTGQTLEFAWNHGWDGSPILENSIADMFAWSPDVTWLSTDPISGTIPGYSSLPIQVTLDSVGLQPDNYGAQLLVISNDIIHPVESVTVTMEVAPTATMGQVQGTVTDAWTGDPLAATVELVGVHTMLADPDYNIWAEAGSYTLQAYAPPDYYTFTLPVDITAGGIAVQNIPLEPALPRLEWTPPEIEMIVAAGDTTQTTLTLDNTGPIPLNFTIHEFIPEVIPLNPEDLDGKRILYDRGHGQPPTYDYDTLIADLVAAGAEVDENFTFPITAATLEDYDVLWSNCCGNTNWTFGELSIVEDWLNAGGAVLIQGENSPATTGPAGIFDIVYDYSGCFDGPTTDIHAHPISNGVAAVYIDYTCSQLVTGDGTDIVVYGSQAQPHIAAHEASGGKMVVVSSEDFTDWTIDNEDNRLLALNTMTWLANPAYTDLDWLSVAPDNGTIPGHDQQAVAITVDATTLSSGAHTAMLAIEHNDPAQPFPVEIPVSAAVVNPAITLQKTVGLEPAVCAATDSIEVQTGTGVTYCFVVTNTGDVMLNVHDLVDSELGNLLAGANITLMPGASHQVLETTVIREDTTNTATWTAALDGAAGVAATATDSATVTTNNDVYLPIMMREAVAGSPETAGSPTFLMLGMAILPAGVIGIWSVRRRRSGD